MTKNKISKVLNNHRQKIRFALVGGICYSLGLPIQWTLTSILGIHYLISYGIAVIFSSSLNWLLNRRWTFESKSKSISLEMTRHQISNLFTTAMGAMAYAMTVSWLGINYILANISITAIMFFANYSLQRKFVFVKTGD